MDVACPLTKTPVSDYPAGVRADFISKVYSILTMQLLLTAGAAAFCAFEPHARAFALSNQPAYVAALCGSIATLVAMACYEDRHPTNVIALLLFTLCESYLIGVLCAAYYAHGAGAYVAFAFAITSVLFSALTLFVCATRRDFSALGGTLTLGLCFLLGFALIGCAVGTTQLQQGAVAFVGCLLFSGYVLYDTSEVVHRLTPDEYVRGAIHLYLDVANLFVYVLEVLRCVFAPDVGEIVE